jgi:quercetin 2,3-dioxygenase
MTDPRDQDIPASAIPEVTEDDGTRVCIICGEFWGKRGPVKGVAADPNYLDISVAPRHRKHLKIETTRNAFAYVFAGSGTFRDGSDPRAVLTESAVDPNANPRYDASNHSLVLFDRGDEIAVQAGDEGIRFLLVSGKPIKEPVAWYGPIVMNTQGELKQAMTELQSGTFIKHRQRNFMLAPDRKSTVSCEIVQCQRARSVPRLAATPAPLCAEGVSIGEHLPRNRRLL